MERLYCHCAKYNKSTMTQLQCKKFNCVLIPSCFTNYCVARNKLQPNHCLAVLHCLVKFLFRPLTYTSKCGCWTWDAPANITSSFLPEETTANDRTAERRAGSCQQEAVTDKNSEGRVTATTA